VRRGRRQADDRAPTVAEDQHPTAGQIVDERAGVGGLHGEFHRSSIGARDLPELRELPRRSYEITMNASERAAAMPEQ